MPHHAIFAALLAAGCATGAAAAPPRPATEPVLVSFTSDGRELHGFLYRPAGDGPFPAVVYNHGSERKPGQKAPIAGYFVAHGYVVLVPHRRGHGRSPGPNIRDTVAAAPLEEQPAIAVAGLVAQSDDVVAAIGWLAAQPFVDRDRIAIAGCSYGGIETLLTAERPDAGVRAAVDFAGGAMSWDGNAALRDRLRAAAVAAKVPVFLLQAENDFSTLPTQLLAAEMERAGRPHQSRIYPPHGTTHMDGHGGFCRDPAIWGDDVLGFLDAHLGGQLPARH